MMLLLAVSSLQVAVPAPASTGAGGGAMYLVFGLPIVIFLIWAIVDSAKSRKERPLSKDYRQPSIGQSKENDSFKVAEDGTIIRISGIQTCPQCKAPVTANAKYCPECGVKLQ